jgi:signal transduction histidine kinase
VKIKFKLFIAVIILAGLIGAGYLAYLEISGEQERLLDRASTIGRLMSPNDILQLKGDVNDLKTENYAVVKELLQDVKKVNPDLHFAYIARLNDHNQVYFAVDAEPDNSAGFSPPGQIYGDASIAFENIFKSGKPIVEGPAKDGWGYWYSGLAPIFSDESYTKVVAVVGIDRSAWSVFILAGLYALIPLLLVALIVTILVIQQRSINKTEAILRQKAQFVTIASHDIRSPLTGLLWGLEVLVPILSKNKNPDVVALSQQMYIGCQQVIGTVSSVLDTMQMENDGKAGELRRAPTDIIELIRDSVALHALSGNTKGVSLTFEGKWPTSYVQAVEASSMGRAIANVIGNAVKYTNPKTVIKLKFSKNADHWQVAVIDQGEGIPAADLDKIGEQFFRGKAATGKITGTGLGMYFTKQIIERHGGELDIKSVEKVGTTATIIIPTYKDTAAEPKNS